MPYSTINGSNAFNWSGLWSQPSFSGPIWVPQTRPGHNGARPIIINAIYAYITGRFSAPSVGCYIGNQGIGSTGVPNSYGNVSPHTATFAGAGYYSGGSGYWDTMRFTSSGPAIWMVYRAYGGLNITNTTGYVWYNKSFVGGMNYLEVPTAPSTPTLSQITSSSIRVTFNGPSDDGGTGVNGYRIQIANNSSFTNATNHDVSGHYTIRNLSPGTRYWVRVFAKNALFNSFGVGSQWSGVASASTIIEPPSWTDTTLGTLMRVGQAYSDGVSAYTQIPPVTYAISGGKLPDGIVLDTNTGAITGTPTLQAIQNGPTYNFTITATNAGGQNSVSFSRTVVAEQSAWTDNIINTDMRVALPYEDQLSATGTGVEYTVGAPGPTPRPDTYEVVPGVEIDRNTGIVSGIPTTAGEYTVTIYATNDSAEFDPNGQVQQTFKISVKPTGKRYDTKTTTEYLQNIRRWNGTEWVDVGIIRKWDGTKWELLEMQ